MQVVWSRTAQTRSCRCHSCLHSATTLARRTTTAASKRRLKASDVFTACYSAMFATAALVDMKFKEDRRKQWDIAIAEARSSRNVIQTIDSSSTTEGAVNMVESGHLNSENLIQHNALSNLGAHEWGSIKTLNVPGLEKCRLMSSSKGQDTTLEAKLKVQSNHVRRGRSDIKGKSTKEGGIPVVGKEADFDSALRHGGELQDLVPESLVHLEHAQQMVLKLVTRLLIWKESFSSGILAAAPADYDFHMECKIRSRKAMFLKTGDIWCPTYSASNLLPFGGKVAILNESIVKILKKEESTPTGIKSAVAKICYTLLMSSAPPNIDTYNIMLVHFTRLKRRHLAQAVVDSFFQDSEFRPNSFTVTAILDHYAAIKSRNGFEGFVHRMRGRDGDMRLSRRSWPGLGDPAVKPWKGEREVIYRNGFLIKKMPQNTEIFNSLILGSLRCFGGKRASTRAAMYLKSALRKSCYISRYLFVRVAQACLSEKNKKAAIALLSAIIPQWHKSRGSWQQGAHADSRELILQLMDLCGIPLSINGYFPLPGNLRKVDFQVFKAWVRSINLEVLDEHLRRSASSISGLEILFAAFSYKTFTTEQVVLWMLALIERHPVTRPKGDLEALVTAIQLVMDGFSSGCRGLESQVLDIIYGGLSTDLQRDYDAISKRSPDTNMASKLAILQSLAQKRREIQKRDRFFDVRGDQARSLAEGKKQEWDWEPSIACAWT